MVKLIFFTFSLCRIFYAVFVLSCNCVLVTFITIRLLFANANFSFPFYGCLAVILYICIYLIYKIRMKERNKRVLVGMSGGIDSTATCLMLQEQGYEIVGVTMRVWGDEPQDVGELAVRMGIEHHAADERIPFKEAIVKNFIDEYKKGRTPNPCVMCNPLFKFRVLTEWADKLDCAWVATGHYALMSREASRAADKGIIVVCSAGNSGAGSWKKITPPGDAENVITVGTVDKKGELAPFSSAGNTSGGRVKPDVVAVGLGSDVMGTNGNLRHANGTSFSAPIMCGMVAYLWQSCPKLTAKEIIELVRRSGDRTDFPNNIYGYGMPDLWKAYTKVNGAVTRD